MGVGTVNEFAADASMSSTNCGPKAQCHGNKELMIFTAVRLIHDTVFGTEDGQVSIGRTDGTIFDVEEKE